jgi:hypothetical protein
VPVQNKVLTQTLKPIADHRGHESRQEIRGSVAAGSALRLRPNPLPTARLEPPGTPSPGKNTLRVNDYDDSASPCASLGIRNRVNKQIRWLCTWALLVVCHGQLTAQKAASKPDLGPNVSIFDPSMPAAAIQRRINDIYTTSDTTSLAISAKSATSSTIRAKRPQSTHVSHPKLRRIPEP